MASDSKGSNIEFSEVGVLQQFPMGGYRCSYRWTELKEIKYVGSEGAVKSHAQPRTS